MNSFCTGSVTVNELWVVLQEPQFHNMHPSHFSFTLERILICRTVTVLQLILSPILLLTLFSCLENSEICWISEIQGRNLCEFIFPTACLCV